MIKVFRWYFSLKWWKKILISIPVGLIALAALYTLARAAQYRQCATTAPRRFLPLSADAVVIVDKPEKEWRRLAATGMWKNVEASLHDDPALRQTVSSLLLSCGMPSLEQLEDKRYVRKHLSEATEDNIFRFFSDEAAGAVNFARGGEKSRFVLSGRLSFFDFWLAPVAELLAPLAVDVTKSGCVAITTDFGTFFIRRAGAILIAGNDERMVAEGAEGKGTKSPSEGDTLSAWLSSDANPEIRRKIADVAAAAKIADLFPSLDFERSEGASLRLTFDDDSISSAMNWEGAALRGIPPDEKTKALLRIVPKDTFCVLRFSSGIHDLWTRLKNLAATPTQKKAGVESLSKDLLAELVKQLSRNNIESSLFPLLGDNGVLLLGPAAKEGSPTQFPAMALAIDVAKPAEALALLDDISRNILAGDQGQMKILTYNYQGCDVRYLFKKSDPLILKETRDLCYATIGNRLVISSSFHFVNRMIDCETGGAMTFLDIQEPAGSASIAVDFDAMAKTAESFVADIAEYTTDNDEMRKRLRDKHEAEFNRRRPPIEQSRREETIARLVREDLESEITKTADGMRETLHLLQRIGRVSLSAEKGDRSVTLLFRWSGMCGSGKPSSIK